jgi:ankyrin repeat protein
VPDLATARVGRTDPPYDGYFHGATLLHHVAGNPLIRALPDNVVQAASLLLERGAEVDAVTLAGPSQPDDIGWTTLGLAATSAEARRAGRQAELIERLLEAGADPDALNGGSLVGALYYGESAAAEALAAAGATLDIPAAAGVGDVATLRELLAGADPGPRLARYGLVPWPDGAGRADVLGLALVYAALHGRVEALRLLLDEGADVDHRPPFDHGATALHWAVMGDRPDSVRVLLEAGADPGARDATFGSTPAGWAEHLGRPRAAEALGS